MTKIDALDEVIELLIKKVVEEDTHKQNLRKKPIERVLKGERVHGLPSTAGKRK